MGEHGERIAEVIFTAEQGRLLLGVGPAPLLRQAGTAIGGRRHLYARRQGERPRGAFETFFLADVVQVQAQALAAIIQGNGAHPHVAMLIVHGGVASLQAAVEAHAKLVLLTETAADIQVAADLGVGGVTAGKAGEVLVQRALGHDVDHPAHATVGRDAVHQRPRPLEHFNTLGVLGECAVVGRHAIHAVIGQLTQVALANRKAPHEKRVDNTAGLPGRTYRRVTLQGIGHGHSLQVGEGLGGVAGHAERRVHHVLVAQHAQACATGHLAASEHLGQVGGAQIAGVDVRRVKGQALRAVAR